jgi:hypothetical protein
VIGKRPTARFREREERMMDRTRTNEAAEQLVEATWDTYKTLVGHALSLQQRNERFVRQMVDDSIEELRRQAEENRSMTHELLELAEDQREAFREAVEASVLDAYTRFLFSPFTPLSYYRERTRSGEPGSVAESITSEGNGSLPLEDYDELSVSQVSGRLKGLSKYEIRVIRAYEQRHKNRETLRETIDKGGR